MESGLQRFQCRANAGYHPDDIGDVVAIAVGAPHRVLIGARDLPGDVVASCRLLRTDRGPAAELTRYNGRAAIFQLGASPAAVEKKTISNLGQTCRSERLNHGVRNADRAVAVQVLMESGLQRLQCRANAGYHPDDIGDVVAAAVGVPDRILIGARDLPGDVVASCRLLRTDRGPDAELTRYNGRAAIL